MPVEARRVTFAKLPDGTRIECEDLDFEVVKEPWGVYKLKDGTIIRVKTVIGKISRGIDPETGGILRHPSTGEPFFNVLHNVLIMAEVPQSLMKREGK